MRSIPETFPCEADHPGEERQAFLRRDFLLPLFLVLLHLAFVMLMLNCCSLSIKADPGRNYWDYFWQLLPADFLQTDLLRSLWNLHSQPPLYNLLGTLIMRLNPAGSCLETLYVLNVIMGAALCGLLYFPAQALLRRRWLSTALCGLVALHPSLLLYEAYALYDVLTAFLIVVTLACMAFFCREHQLRWLTGFIVGLNLLILTRTIFHPAVLGPALLLVCIWSGTRWRRMLVLALIISLPTAAWCTKNYVKFGFWGTTSWTGMNLWRIAASDYPDAERGDLVKAGLLNSMVAADSDFRWPCDFVEYGFNATSSVPALNGNDFNNINIPAASRVYQSNALRLIRHDPLRYLHTVRRAFLRFCRPSFEFGHLEFNARTMPGYLRFWRRLHGRQPRWLAQTQQPVYGSVWMVLYVGALVLFILRTLHAWLFRKEPFLAIIRGRPVEFALAYLCIWVTFVGSTCEIGENDRFKFIVEFPGYVFVAAMLTWAFQGVAGWLTAKLKTMCGQVGSE
ncbi:MAG: glycosyltransferase family 39 protein [Verrucomicrobia bacterium]|nr:glycosyltransferase family 39 protein [Verrucomicrobiota bacterium]MBU1735881.1 glycosyltransferase family 39 protein [Verrucomicrobiota bacterium]MBU1855932.1 glycosyltransferase family 39 protein [Verrucomicrobiota bacterium]